MRYLSQLTKEQIGGKKCLLRINLDIQDPTKESLRINTVIPTIKFLTEAGCRITIMGHRGRPQGVEPALSVKPLIEVLSKKADVSLQWLENLRFDAREQANDDNFAQELAAKGDFYVNDDFATSHRANASLSAITRHLPSYAGFLLEKEIDNLSKIINNPQQPLVVIIGGVKIDDKTAAMTNLQHKAQALLMGSAYINLEHPSLKSPKVILPVDWLGENDQKLDIGEKTIAKFSQIIAGAKTIFWAGPLGKFEDVRYLEGSRKIAEVIAATEAFSLVGGGDTYQLLTILKMENCFGFLSTGGGAMLEFLAGKYLPALEALDKCPLV
jgi:phosphoglycerate kinase